MNEYAGAVTRFADDLFDIGASAAQRERGIFLYMQALTAPSIQTWHAFYRYVFDVIAKRQRIAAPLASDAAARLIALIMDDLGAGLFATRWTELLAPEMIKDRSA
jgi:hypothetical protein